MEKDVHRDSMLFALAAAMFWHGHLQAQETWKRTLPDSVIYGPHLRYAKNTSHNSVRADITGVCRYKYSDDDGITWRVAEVWAWDRGSLPMRHPNSISTGLLLSAESSSRAREQCWPDSREISQMPT